MKKEYVNPEIKVIQIHPGAIICESVLRIYDGPPDTGYPAW